MQNVNDALVPFQSIARKCTLPARVCGPDTVNIVENAPSLSISDEKVHALTLRAFLYEYCIQSTDHSLSRGFLDGLEPMLHQLGPASDLAKACRTVSFASHGIKLRRESLYSQAESSYCELLGSLAETLKVPRAAKTGETVMIAILLGLYEV
jgi:hypothetical protein